MGTQGSPVKSYDYLLKFLLVGDSDVGKGEILESLQDGASESPYAYSNGKGEAPRGDGAAGAAGGPWRGGGARCGGGARRGRSVPSPRLCPIRRPLRSAPIGAARRAALRGNGSVTKERERYFQRGAAGLAVCALLRLSASCRRRGV